MWARYTGPRAEVGRYGILTPGEDVKIDEADFDAALFTKHEPRLATVDQFPCGHRGDRIGARVVGGCRSGRRIEPVYSCSVYGRCAMRSSSKDVAVCLGCEEREY